MAQVPGLGLDQSQLADIINQQYKGYSQKQRNQMMQSAAATPLYCWLITSANCD